MSASQIPMQIPNWSVHCSRTTFPVKTHELNFCGYTYLAGFALIFETVKGVEISMINFHEGPTSRTQVAWQNIFFYIGD